MSVPQGVLFAFAVWTVMVPLTAIAVYRWARIVQGLQSIETFRADAVEGPDWYRRAMRAHANCVENLPVLAVVVWTLSLLGLESALLDGLALLYLASRIVQTSVHIGLLQTRIVASVRFLAFFVQLLCVLAMASLAVAAAPPP